MVLADGLSPRIYWIRLEKRSQALRGRNLARDIQAPVRQCRVRPLMAFVTRGRSLESHWTPDLCLRKSCGAAAFGVTTCVCARFGRMNPISTGATAMIAKLCGRLAFGSLLAATVVWQTATAVAEQGTLTPGANVILRGSLDNSR